MSTKLHILSILNDLNTLIRFEIELKIRGPTIYSQNLELNYFILLQLYINSKLPFFEKIIRLVDQYCLYLLGGSTSIFHITFKYL